MEVLFTTLFTTVYNCLYIARAVYTYYRFIHIVACEVKHGSSGHFI